MYKLLYSKNRSKKGFTLMEMLIVIAIIAILVAIIVPIMSGQTAEAERAKDNANARSITAMIAVECLEDSVDPANVDAATKATDLSSLDANGKANTAWRALENEWHGTAKVVDGVVTATY